MPSTPIRRNEPCPCGSGKRYKDCHGSIGQVGTATDSSRRDGEDALMQQAREAMQRNDYVTASACCERLLLSAPGRADAWAILGQIDLQRGDHTSAVNRFARAIAIDPERADFRASLARAQYGSGMVANAVESARTAVALDAANADAWNVLGLCVEATNPAEAVAAWEKAAALAPAHPEAHFRIGNLQRREGSHDLAIAAYRRALAGAPHPVLQNNLGLALQAKGELQAAERSYREAIEQQPTLLEAVANLAGVLQQQGRFADAIPWYERAVALSPRAGALWSGIGACQYRIGDHAAAHASFGRALEYGNDDPKAMVNMASMLLAERRYDEALPLLEKALAREPGFDEAENVLLYTQQQICRWDDLEAMFLRQRERIRLHRGPPVSPHNLLALPYSPADQLVAARDWVERQIGAKPTVRPATPRHEGRLRIGYLGADFRSHALANLLTEVIERHDRARFEVFGYSFGPDDRSAARARFERAFDHFFDVRAETPAASVQRIRNDGIAILFDTSGHVIYARGEIFAARAAPIQINCIGFPGTLGADYYDYILTDRFVSPPGQQVHFAERFMYLPHCYMPGDTRRPIGAAPNRAQCGLPQAGFVFCCFNGSYKMQPAVFDIWMRLLRDVPQSVLWLLDTDPLARANLEREARQRSVAPERLVFAPRMPVAEHLARHGVAHLFLDTFPCNAHTTTNDALFAGLPVVTCAGETFASRVSGSHLHAIGLPELVTHSLADYEALALRLAREPDTLAEFRNRLRVNRKTHPLFDTIGYTRALEELLLHAVAERR